MWSHLAADNDLENFPTQVAKMVILCSYTIGRNFLQFSSLWYLNVAHIF